MSVAFRRDSDEEHLEPKFELPIPPGETVVTTMTFPSQGSLLFGCHLPGHYAYGMRGLISIA